MARRQASGPRLAIKSLIGAVVLLTAAAVGSGCSRAAEAPGTAPPGSGAPPAVPAVAASSFVNRVWRVAQSPTVAAGQLYVFLSDGTLVVTSPQSKPLLGRWQQDGDRLQVTEEGITYRVDILALSSNEFHIHYNDPGAGVDLRLVPATLP